MSFAITFFFSKGKGRSSYFADVLRGLVWSAAEFSTNLEVTDTANCISQLCELLTAQYQHGLVWFVLFVLKSKQ